jgi:hypothetical protein
MSESVVIVSINRPSTAGAGAVDPEDVRVAEIVSRGPRGALVLAALMVGIVVGLWVAFYLFAFLPRGPIG